MSCGKVRVVQREDFVGLGWQGFTQDGAVRLGYKVWRRVAEGPGARIGRIAVRCTLRAARWPLRREGQLSQPRCHRTKG